MIDEAYTELVNGRAEKDDEADPIEEVGQAVSIMGALVPIEVVQGMAALTAESQAMGLSDDPLLPIEQVQAAPDAEPVFEMALPVGPVDCPPAGGSAAAPDGATVYTWGDRSCWFVGEHTAADVEAAFKAPS